MERTSIRIGVVVAAGAFIGALLALELSSTWWWLGALTGGLYAYLAYDFKAVIQAIPRAIRFTNREVFQRKWSFVEKDFLWHTSPLVTLASGLFISNILILLLLTGYGLDRESQSLLEFLADGFSGYKWIWPCIPAIGCPLLFALLEYFHACGKAKQSLTKYWLDRACLRKVCLRMISWANPVMVFLVWPALAALALGVVLGIGIPILGLIAMIALPFGLLIAGKWIYWAIYHTIRLVHCDERMMCAAYAMIGATTGYIVGSALIGALAGGLAAFTTYELLVRRSIRARASI